MSSQRHCQEGLIGTLSLGIRPLTSHASSTYAGLQDRIAGIFENLKSEEYLAAHGLRQERLLSQGDPNKVIYSLLLYERTIQGNLLRL